MTDKKKGAIPFENAPHGTSTAADSTRVATLRAIALAMPGNSAADQRLRLLTAIRETGSVTTTEARLHLEIMNPSQRVTELRQQGLKIDTTWTHAPSEAGCGPHRQALYVPVPSNGRDAA